MSKVNLGSRKGIQTKILQVLLRLTKRKVVGFNFLNLLAPLVARDTIYEKCLVDTNGFFGCGKNDHKVKVVLLL